MKITKKITFFIAFIFAICLLFSRNTNVHALKDLPILEEAKATPTENSDITFTLNGDSTIHLVSGDSYVELGATAIEDNNDITENILIDNSSVNTNVAGTYFVKYEVSDFFGNVETITREVIVYTKYFNDNMLYHNPTSFFAENCSLYIDGNPYVAGTEYDEIGKHILTVKYNEHLSREYSFTVQARISVTSINEDNTSFNIVLENGERFYIDGKEYSSPVYNYDVVGIHQVCVYGFGDYQWTHTFEVKDNIKVESEYNGKFVLEYSNCEVTIDGQKYTSGTAYKKVGYHTLEVIGANGYKKTYNFTLKENISINEVYYDSFQLVFSYYEVYIDGEKYTTSKKYTKIGHHTLVIKGTGGYTSEYYFELIGIEYKKEYFLDTDPFVLIFDENYKVTVNGELYNSGTIINEIGKYKLSIESDGKDILKDYEFYIRTGFKQEEYYKDVFIYEFKDFNVTIGGKEYKSKEAITTVGEYILEIIGKDYTDSSKEYKETYTITILPWFVETTDYTKEFKVAFSDYEIYLDGKLYESNTPINKVGKYQLEIKATGENSVLKELEINILPEFQAEYLEVFKYKYTGYKIKIDGKDYKSDTEYKVIGNHDLDIYDNDNRYLGTVKIAITPDLTINDLYTGSFQLEYSGYRVKIDNANYVSNDKYKIIGHHELIVIGANNYTKKYPFTLKEEINIEDGATYKRKIQLEVGGDNAIILLDGKQISNVYKCSEVGNHTLVIIGSKKYQTEYKFTIDAEVFGVKDGSKHNSKSVSWAVFGDCEIYLDGVKIDALGSNNGKVYNTELVGYHKLQIIGREYVKTINFTIEGQIIQDSKDGDIRIDAPGCSIYVNGTEKGNDNLTLTEIGTYHVEIRGSNEYVGVHTLTITEGNIGVNEGDKSYNYIIRVSNKIVGAYLNGVNILNNYDKVSYGIKDPGTYKLEIHGLGGYVNVYNFEVPFTFNVIQNKIYTNAYNVSVNGMKVNVSTFTFTEAGNNKIVLIGENATLEKTYFVDVKTKFKDGAEFDKGVWIEATNSRVFIDGVEIFENTYIEKHGEHTVEYVGVGGYSLTYTFRVNNPNVPYAVFGTIIIGTVAIGFAVLLIIRKKVI